MKPVVYIDMLFLLNFLMDSVTLYTAALCLRKNLNILRMLLSATVAALYSTVMFFPQLTFMYSILTKTIFLFLISYLAFPSKTPAVILKNGLVVFGVNTVLGGTILAIIFATDFGVMLNAAVSNGEVYMNISFEMLLISIILAYTIMYIITYIKTQNIKSARHSAVLTIYLNGKSITVSALCDTGCTLCDPISGVPAVIISQSSAHILLPEECPEARYRPLPFTTIDNSKGILDGFIPDKLIIDDEEITHSVVGISKTDIDTYSAIFNPQILENIIHRKAVDICELPDNAA